VSRSEAQAPDTKLPAGQCCEQGTHAKSLVLVPSHVPLRNCPSGQLVLQGTHNTSSRSVLPSHSSDRVRYCPATQAVRHGRQLVASSLPVPGQLPVMYSPASHAVQGAQLTASVRLVPSQTPRRNCPAAHTVVHGRHWATSERDVPLHALKRNCPASQDVWQAAQTVLAPPSSRKRSGPQSAHLELEPSEQVGASAQPATGAHGAHAGTAPVHAPSDPHCRAVFPTRKNPSKQSNVATTRMLAGVIGEACTRPLAGAGCALHALTSQSAAAPDQWPSTPQTRDAEPASVTAASSAHATDAVLGYRPPLLM
jgi:hypothetical protein